MGNHHHHQPPLHDISFIIANYTPISKSNVLPGQPTYLTFNHNHNHPHHSHQNKADQQVIQSNHMLAIQKYLVLLELPEDQIQKQIHHYTSRMCVSPFLVRVCNFQFKKEEANCLANIYYCTIYTEHIGYRLDNFKLANKMKGNIQNAAERVGVRVTQGCMSADKKELQQLQSLSFDQGIYILISTLHGYEQLCQYERLCYPSSKSIGINSNAQVKVWLNQNFSLNQVSLKATTQHFVIEEIVNLIQERVKSPHFSTHIPNYQQATNNYTLTFTLIQDCLASFVINYHQGKKSLLQKINNPSQFKDINSHQLKTINSHQLKTMNSQVNDSQINHFTNSPANTNQQINKINSSPLKRSMKVRTEATNTPQRVNSFFPQFSASTANQLKSPHNQLKHEIPTNHNSICSTKRYYSIEAHHAHQKGQITLHQHHIRANTLTKSDIKTSHQIQNESRKTYEQHSRKTQEQHSRRVMYNSPAKKVYISYSDGQLPPSTFVRNEQFSNKNSPSSANSSWQIHPNKIGQHNHNLHQNQSNQPNHPNQCNNSNQPNHPNQHLVQHVIFPHQKQSKKSSQIYNIESGCSSIHSKRQIINQHCFSNKIVDKCAITAGRHTNSNRKSREAILQNSEIIISEFQRKQSNKAVHYQPISLQKDQPMNQNKEYPETLIEQVKNMNLNLHLTNFSLKQYHSTSRKNVSEEGEQMASIKDIAEQFRSLLQSSHNISKSIESIEKEGQQFEEQVCESHYEAQMFSEPESQVERETSYGEHFYEIKEEDEEQSYDLDSKESKVR